MRRANISCGRSTVIDRDRLRRGLIGLLVAGALLHAAASMAAPPEERVNADPAFPFSNEIAAFVRAREAGPVVQDAVLFLGSSSIRLWDIGASFPDRAIVNRGFGGATTADVLHHYARLLPRAAPRSVIVYVGENDLAEGATPDRVARELLTLLKRLRSDFPKARIACLSLKPSPIRWTLWPKMAAVNMTVAARARVVGFEYVDMGGALLARDGLPDASLFRPDGLHLNARGYERWTAIINGWLDAKQTALSD
jgi:lysophospholipase L1-like esterase